METNYNVTFTNENEIEFTKDSSFISNYDKTVKLELTINELDYLHGLVLNDNIRATRNEVIHQIPKSIESNVVLRKVDALCVLINE